MEYIPAPSLDDKFGQTLSEGHQLQLVCLLVLVTKRLLILYNL